MIFVYKLIATWVIFGAEFVVKSTARSIRRQSQAHVRQKLNILHTEISLHKIQFLPAS